MSNVITLNSGSAPDYKDISRPPVVPRDWSFSWMLQSALRFYARVHHALLKPAVTPTSWSQLREVRASASTLTDIDEHMELMFVEGLLCRPKVIVELGVRGGASTLIFGKVADLHGATLISVDLDDCSFVNAPGQWHFVKSDDVRFAGEFPAFCRERGIVPFVDLLFIDTSHYYDHTVHEIAAWFPLLSPNAKVIFHDTNLKALGRRKDGSVQVAWDNRRGVIRAIEEYLGTKIDETREHTDYVHGWLIRHWPTCNGLTILDRIEDAGVARGEKRAGDRKSA